MASDVKKAKAEPAPKKEAAAKEKSTSSPDASKTADSAKTEAPKAEASEAAGSAPKNYSRGEGQKPVTQAYKDNWNAIFGKDKKKKRR